MERNAFHEATMSAVQVAVGLLLLMLGPAGLAHAQDVMALARNGLSVEPTAVDFGDVGRGALVTHDVTVTNTGHGHHDEVRVTGVKRPGTGDCALFQLQAPAAFPITMAPGQKATWRVTMQGNAVGHHECTIELLDDDGKADVVQLSGDILAPRVTVQPATVLFGDVPVGGVSDHRLVITNEGTANLTISAITAGGSAEFALSGLTAPTSIPARATRVLTVTYQPAAAGADTGTVQIVHGGGALSIPLSGTGADPDTDVSLDPDSYYTCSGAPGGAGGAVAAWVVVLCVLRRRRTALRQPRTATSSAAKRWASPGHRADT
jgi:hypothetical protein